MSVIVVGVLAVGVLIFWLQDNDRRRRKLLDGWQTAAAELELRIHSPSTYDRSLHGVIEGVSVLAELTYERHGKSRRFRGTLRVGEGGHIPKPLSVRADSFARSLSRLIGGQDQQLGDPDFDQLVELPALDARSCAALSSGVREQLADLVPRGVQVGHGTVTLEQIWHDGCDGAWLVQMLRSLLALTQSLSVMPDTLQQRLAQNALHDPSPGVRLQNLRFLAEPSTGASEALLATTGEALLGDGDPRVRLLAAQLAGAAGHAVLAALAGSPRREMAVRVLAVTALGRPPAAQGALRALLDLTTPPQVLCEALSVVGQRGLNPLADAVLGCTSSEHDAVRAAAASALGALAYRQAEPELIALLSDPSAEVQQKSAEALGALGSVAAVAPLLPLAEGLGRPQLRRAARGAIGRIQSRLGDVDAGRVSLAREQELVGALELADTAGVRVGELTLADDVASDEQDAPPDELTRGSPGKSR